MYKLPEPPKETTGDYIKIVCNIFTDMIGIKTTPQDIEAAHKTSRLGENATLILVRFLDRNKQDELLRNRENH